MLSQIFSAGSRSGASGPEAVGDGTQYVFKPSLVGSASQLDITGEGLSWQMKGKQGIWPLEKIAAIRLSYRPVSMQSRRFRARLTPLVAHEPPTPPLAVISSWSR